MAMPTFGEVIRLSHDGRELRSAVFNEHEVRAAAGLTMAIGAVAFIYANFEKQFLPIKLVTTFFFVEFLIRVTVGLRFSPVGVSPGGSCTGWSPNGCPPSPSGSPGRSAWSCRWR